MMGGDQVQEMIPQFLGCGLKLAPALPLRRLPLAPEGVGHLDPQGNMPDQLPLTAGNRTEPLVPRVVFPKFSQIMKNNPRRQQVPVDFRIKRRHRFGHLEHLRRVVEQSPPARMVVPPGRRRPPPFFRKFLEGPQGDPAQTRILHPLGRRQALLPTLLKLFAALLPAQEKLLLLGRPQLSRCRPVHIGTVVARPENSRQLQALARLRPRKIFKGGRSGKNVQRNPVGLVRQVHTQERLAVPGGLFPPAGKLGPYGPLCRGGQPEKIPQGHAIAPTARFRKRGCGKLRSRSSPPARPGQTPPRPARPT